MQSTFPYSYVICFIFIISSSTMNTFYPDTLQKAIAFAPRKAISIGQNNSKLDITPVETNTTNQSSLPINMTSVDNPFSKVKQLQYSFVKSWGYNGTSTGKFHFPLGIAFDTSSANL